MIDTSPFDSDLLQSTVRLSVPLILAAVGETVAERTGMLNIGLEGMMLAGALGGVLGGHAAGDSPFVGVLCGALAGGLMAAFASLFMITLRADQVVVGVGLVLFAGGLTTFLFREYLSDSTAVGPLNSHAIPVLSDIPVIGQALFNQDLMVYLTYVLIGGTAFVVNRTSWGLLVRAAGQGPRALDAAGHSVVLTRWAGMVFAGAMAGLGGVYLSVGQLGSFNENMTAGRGYIALAAVVFGGWMISRVVGACLIFGGVTALQLRLQAIGATPTSVWVALAIVVVGITLFLAFGRWGPSRSRSEAPGVERRRSNGPVIVAFLLCAASVALLATSPDTQLPAQIYVALPYICALIVLAGFGRSRPAPAALTVPYDRASR